MINYNMRSYDYYLYEDIDSYGQETLSKEVKGEIKISIFTTSTSIQGNINYKDSQYVGFTKAAIDDSYVIQYGEEKLKVLYVMPQGRYKQAFMIKI